MKLLERLYSHKNMFDEMQEQRQLRIESRGCWLAFCGLLAAMAVQGVLHCPASSMAGEWAVFMVLCVYLLVQELRYGLWDRHLKANVWNNLLLSLLAGVVVAVFGCFSWGYWSWVSAFITGGITFTLCFGTLQLCVWAWKRRRRALDRDQTDEEEAQ